MKLQSINQSIIRACYIAQKHHKTTEPFLLKTSTETDVPVVYVIIPEIKENNKLTIPLWDSISQTRYIT